MDGFEIKGITVSVDIGNKQYGAGNSHFISLAARVPEDQPGVTNLDTVMQDGIEMYQTAWQTALQAIYASGDLDSEQYKQKVVTWMVRAQRIGQLYQKIKNKPIEELEAYLARMTQQETPNE